MYRGKDLRSAFLEDRRAKLREIVESCPKRFSDTFNVSISELISTVQEHELEGIVAKRVGSQYRCGERSGDWLKGRPNRGQEFVIGGYVSNAEMVDSVLVGYYQGHDLKYAGLVRAGLTVELRCRLAPHFEKLRVISCPFLQFAR
jgi:bifunctional non-homologous end joining protein LigD